MPIASPIVVVVDDDDSMREAIERLLEAGGFVPAGYRAAEDLLAVGLREGTACVVSDLTLPAMSGLDLLAELRSRGWDLPLILITAHDAPGRDEDALRRGAAAYLAKPFRGTVLLDVIRAAIGSAGTQ